MVDIRLEMRDQNCWITILNDTLESTDSAREALSKFDQFVKDQNPMRIIIDYSRVVYTKWEDAFLMGCALRLKPPAGSAEEISMAIQSRLFLYGLRENPLQRLKMSKMDMFNYWQSVTNRRFLILDLEATCCNDRSIPKKEREIIEIGAVVFDSDGLRIVDKFSEKIRPKRHPQLTEFCTRLMGIQQQDVDQANEFPYVFDRFSTWLRKFGSFTFLHWGSYDRKALMADCSYHGVPYTLPTKSFDFKKNFYREMELGKPAGLGETLRRLGLQFQGRAHSALSDAENTARLMPILLKKNGAVFGGNR